MGEFWSNLRQTWTGMSPLSRGVFACTAAAIVILAVGLIVWSSRSNEQVLFADLESRDAAAIIGELKRMKVPYRIDDDGTRIFVDGKVVHEVRLNLMGRGVPISSGVGFEIFDNKDVGMTESMQKINYQRALQGELARTIMANDQLKSARVHLVVEEGGLFSRDKAHPKGAVSVVLKPGAHLANDQILGIQRLVAAAVPGLDSSQVTVTDQRGIALSSEADTDTAGAPATGKLRLKKQADDYLTRKVTEVLDRAFGPGQAIVSVDATLNFDEIHRSEQNIVPLHGRGDEVGAVVRRRESIYRQSTATAAVKAIDTTADRPADSNGALTSTNEVEYELSKSAEQVVSTPGGIRRVSIGVIVPQSLDDDQLSRVREIVSMAVGFNAERGDAITVQPLGRMMTKAVPVPAPLMAPSEAPTLPPLAKGWRPNDTEIIAALGLTALLLIVIAMLVARQRAAQRSLDGRLSARERQQLLAEIKSWIEAERVSAAGASKG
jgi:flagellar M-ring protein FliF